MPLAFTQEDFLVTTCIQRMTEGNVFHFVHYSWGGGEGGTYLPANRGRGTCSNGKGVDLQKVGIPQSG